MNYWKKSRPPFWIAIAEVFSCIFCVPTDSSLVEFEVEVFFTIWLAASRNSHRFHAVAHHLRWYPVATLANSPINHISFQPIPVIHVSSGLMSSCCKCDCNAEKVSRLGPFLAVLKNRCHVIFYLAFGVNDYHRTHQSQLVHVISLLLSN